MRAEVVKSEALTTMKAELVEAGLLLSDAAARLLRWRWLIGAALVTLGVARLWAGVNIGEPVEFLLVMVLVALYTTQEMFRSNPPATRHGQAIVDRWARRVRVVAAAAAAAAVAVAAADEP